MDRKTSLTSLRESSQVVVLFRNMKFSACTNDIISQEITGVALRYIEKEEELKELFPTLQQVKLKELYDTLKGEWQVFGVPNHLLMVYLRSIYTYNSFCLA